MYYFVGAHFFLRAGEHAASCTNTEGLRKGCSDIAAVQNKMFAWAAWAVQFGLFIEIF